MFAPRSVAVVGASERPGSYGGEVLLNLARLGYGGRVFAVNPRREAVHGVRAFPSLDDLPEVPDAVVVALPAADAPDVVARAREIGCGSAVVFAAGFAEAQRGDLQARLVAAAGDMPVCGPNGNGFVSLPDRVALWGDALREVRVGPVAVISQSGNVAVNALASQRLALHTVVSCGNQAVLDAADFLGAVAERDGVRSVALYVEDDGDGERWCAALERCARAGVRVAVLKAGTSAAGRAAAEAHTGALAGDARVFRALFEECGAAWTEDPHNLLEVANALGTARRPPAAAPPGRAEPARGVAIMTCSGGDSAIAADLAATLGVDLPALAPATVERLRRTLPEEATPANPLDYTSLLWDDTEALRELIAALQDDPAIRQVLVLFDEFDGPAPILDAVGDALLASTLPELCPPGGIAGLRSALLAAKALHVAPDPDRIAEIGKARRAARGAGLEEHEAKALLREAGIPVVPGWTVSDEDAAVAAWRELGGPVALKRTGVRHKSVNGGVILDVDGESAVKQAYRRLGGTVLVERMAAPGTELLVAVRRDGIVPVLVVGLGGVHTELLDKAVIVPLPVSRERVLQALTALGVGASDAVASLATRLTELPLALIELNPVIVRAHQAVAVDALADQEVLTP
ncbi:MAG TPA: acetate--CoA ligase family protein [Solirubrobacter sp.]|nr:acetate--CoA ligase family protein [Solirubrobacter sp.]